MSTIRKITTDINRLINYVIHFYKRDLKCYFLFSKFIYALISTSSICTTCTVQANVKSSCNLENKISSTINVDIKFFLSLNILSIEMISQRIRS